MVLSFLHFFTFYFLLFNFFNFLLYYKMDIIKDSLSTVVNRFDYESSTTVENFAFGEPMVFKEPELNIITPYFKQFGVNMAPQEALDVITVFDVDPSVLAKKDLENRIKLLNIFLTLLNNRDMADMVLKKYFSDMPNQQLVIQNMNNTINLLKRMVKLLILESQQAQPQTGNALVVSSGTIQGYSYNDNKMLKLGFVLLLIIVVVQAYKLYNKK